MRKILIMLIIFLNISPSFALEKFITFELNAFASIDNGKISKDSGTIKQTYLIKENVIYLVKTVNEKINFDKKLFDKYTTSFNKTFDKNGYYLGYYEGGNGHNKSIIQIDKDLQTITLFNWNGLFDNCTIWYGKAVKE